MGVFDKLREPVFLKETSQAEVQLAELEKLLKNASGDTRDEIEQDMKLLSYGLEGEKNIAFELKNSHIPMYILHDLYLECQGLTAQIDYIVITHGYTFVIECKNLIGNIEINNNGDFIRTYNRGRRVIKEGIYSPITQNKRHLELMKQIRCEGKNLVRAALIDKWFYSFNKSVVVLSNPKTILNAKYAKKEIKDQVIRVDQLIEFITKQNSLYKESQNSDKQMLEIAQRYLSWNKECKVDYMAKYRTAVSEVKQVYEQNYGYGQVSNGSRSDQTGIPTVISDRTYINSAAAMSNNTGINSAAIMCDGLPHDCNNGTNFGNTMQTAVNISNQPINTLNHMSGNVVSQKTQDDLIAKLKKYRLVTSRKENIKPYYIFNDEQMMDLIKKMPQDINGLMNVSGFGAKKCEKYGVDLLRVLWERGL